jgi:hypothetical protein
MPSRRPVTNDRLPVNRQEATDRLGEPIADTQTISMSGIVDSILEVGRQRNSLLAQLRTALQSGQDDQALAVARQLCGMSNHEERHPANSRLN